MFKKEKHSFLQPWLALSFEKFCSQLSCKTKQRIGNSPILCSYAMDFIFTM
jgi:hypothetical protein